MAESTSAQAEATSNGGPPEKVSTGNAKGRSGTVNTRGFILDTEFNRLLRWPLNLDQYDMMEKTDPTVRWMLALLSTPMRAALWEIEPPEKPTAEEMEATCFARHAIFEELDGGWDEHLRQALTLFKMGHSVFEEVFDVRDIQFDVDPIDEEGEPKHISRSATVLSELGPRLQRTIYQWNVDPAKPSQLKEIVQRLADGRSPNTCEIDADQLLVYTNEKEGDDFRGISILRSAWKSWFTKAELQNIEAIAFERTAGLPVVYPPSDAGKDQLDSVEEAVKKMRQGENVYLIMPGPKQQARDAIGQGDAWLVEDLAVDASAGMSAEFGNAITRYDTEMARNVMASFMQLGMQETGARATADVQQDPYYQAIEAHVGYIEDVFSERVIRRLVDLNYSVDRYPRLVASKIQAKNVQVVAEAIASLVGAGAVNPDKPLHAYLRDLLDAPEEDPDYEEEQQKKAEQIAAAAPPPGQPGGPDDPNRGKPPAPGKPAAPPRKAEPGKPVAASRRGLRRLLRRKDPEMDTEPVTFGQFMPSRPLRGVEHHIAWQSISDTLDNAQLDIVSIGERVMEGQLTAVTGAVDEAVERADIKAIEAVRFDPAPLAAALEDELHRIYATGQSDVRAEVRRQQVALADEGREVPEAMADREPGEPPQVPTSRTEIAAIITALATQLAEGGSEAMARAMKQRALKTLAQRAKTADTPGENPLAELRAALRKQAPLAANRIYNLGRMDEVKSLHYRGMVPVVIRSAVLDANTCEACEAEDGSIFRPEAAPPLPDPFCDGGDRCRCIYIPDIAPPEDTSLP